MKHGQLSSKSELASRALLLALPLALALLPASAVAQGSLKDNPEEWVNPFLGPEYARWMVGALGFIASDDERTEYLLLENDEQAAAFVEDFWASRSQLRGTYEERAAEADKKFSERTIPGSRTDRGTIYVLFGPPNETEFEEHRDINDPIVEMWRYGKGTPKGLHGKKVRGKYRFYNDGEMTRFFWDNESDPRARRYRLENPRRPGRFGGVG